jgi:hypothetical protein
MRFCGTLGVDLYVKTLAALRNIEFFGVRPFCFHILPALLSHARGMDSSPRVCEPPCLLQFAAALLFQPLNCCKTKVHLDMMNISALWASKPLEQGQLMSFSSSS